MKSKESSLESPKSGQVTAHSGATATNPIVLAFRIEKIESELKKSGNLESDVVEM